MPPDQNHTPDPLHPQSQPSQPEQVDQVQASSTVGAMKVIQPSETIVPDGQSPIVPMSNAQPSAAVSAAIAENIVLQDTGYLQNVFQGGLSAKSLTLTLYNTHLRIDNAETGETMEDVPINQIRKTTRYFSSRLAFGIYTSLIGSRFLVIKTTQKKYKISWVNSDKQSMMLGGGEMGGEVVAQENFTKTMQWVKAIKDLRAGQPVS
jgi:hypothetical protein